MTPRLSSLDCAHHGLTNAVETGYVFLECFSPQGSYLFDLFGRQDRRGVSLTGLMRTVFPFSESVFFRRQILQIRRSIVVSVSVPMTDLLSFRARS